MLESWRNKTHNTLTPQKRLAINHKQTFLFSFAGAAGLLLARTLLRKKLETNVCVFEKESHLGGKIFDYRFPEAQNITVGQFSTQLIIK